MKQFSYQKQYSLCRFNYVCLSFSYVHLSFNYVRLSFTYVCLSFNYVRLSFDYVCLSFNYVHLSFNYVFLSFNYHISSRFNYVFLTRDYLMTSGYPPLHSTILLLVDNFLLFHRNRSHLQFPSTLFSNLVQERRIKKPARRHQSVISGAFAGSSTSGQSILNRY